MISKPCFRHPEEGTNRTCFNCKRPICHYCQYLLGGHYFCSYSCHHRHEFNALRNNFLLWIRSLFESFRHSFFELFNRPDFHNIRRRWAGATVLLVSIILLSALIIRKMVLATPEGVSVNNDVIDNDSEERPVEEEQFGEKILQGGKVTFNHINIEGEAPENHVVTLSINGKLVRSAIPKNEKFLFSGVTLDQGENEITVRAISQDGAVYLLQRGDFYYNNPVLDYLAKDFKRGNVNRKQIALTFDGGSDANVTDDILEVLEESNIRCTMFLTGEYIKRFPEQVNKILQLGHEIGNHTYNHPHLTTFEENRRHNTLPDVNRKFINDQLKKTEEIFYKITGKKMSSFWRAPYGELNSDIRFWAAELGYRHINWTRGRNWNETMDTLDWVKDENSPVYRSSKEVLTKVLGLDKLNDKGASGGIFLMHLGTQRKREQVHLILSEMISGLQEQGYQIVTISELIRG